MNDNQQQTDIPRVDEWLSGEIQLRVSRKLLMAGGIVLLVLLGIALD